MTRWRLMDTESGKALDSFPTKQESEQMLREYQAAWFWKRGGPAGGSGRYHVEPDATRNRVQAQDSLEDQMRRVHLRANLEGDCDAADWIAREFFLV